MNSVSTSIDFAAEPIAEMTEQRTAERPRQNQKADGVAAERGQCARERIKGREERLVEH
ncbi:MAG: hypothetical protein WDN50_15240 [Bradyrhizobium sp.]